MKWHVNTLRRRGGGGRWGEVGTPGERSPVRYRLQQPQTTWLCVPLSCRVTSEDLKFDDIQNRKSGSYVTISTSKTHFRCGATTFYRRWGGGAPRAWSSECTTDTTARAILVWKQIAPVFVKASRGGRVAVLWEQSPCFVVFCVLLRSFGFCCVVVSLFCCLCCFVLFVRIAAPAN